MAQEDGEAEDRGADDVAQGVAPRGRVLGDQAEAERAEGVPEAADVAAEQEIDEVGEEQEDGQPGEAAGERARAQQEVDEEDGDQEDRILGAGEDHGTRSTGAEAGAEVEAGDSDGSGGSTRLRAA